MSTDARSACGHTPASTSLVDDLDFPLLRSAFLLPRQHSHNTASRPHLSQVAAAAIGLQLPRDAAAGRPIHRCRLILQRLIADWLLASYVHQNGGTTTLVVEICMER